MEGATMNKTLAAMLVGLLAGAEFGAVAAWAAEQAGPPPSR